MEALTNSSNGATTSTSSTSADLAVATARAYGSACCASFEPSSGTKIRSYIPHLRSAVCGCGASGPLGNKPTKAV